MTNKIPPETEEEIEVKEYLDYLVKCGLLRRTKRGYINAHKIMNIQLNRDVIMDIYKRTEKESYKQGFQAGQMSKGIFTTSMNRKVCYDAGYEAGQKQSEDAFKEMIENWLKENTKGLKLSEEMKNVFIFSYNDILDMINNVKEEKQDEN